MAKTRRRRGEGQPQRAGRCKRTGKVRYRDYIAAEVALSNTRSARSSKREENRTYLCEFCRGWHLTSQAKGNNSHKGDFHVQT